MNRKNTKKVTFVQKMLNCSLISILALLASNLILANTPVESDVFFMNDFFMVVDSFFSFVSNVFTIVLFSLSIYWIVFIIYKSFNLLKIEKSVDKIEKSIVKQIKKRQVKKAQAQIPDYVHEMLKNQ